ncbi:APC family permease [Kitasatospora atroaurantiaca]|uniref:Amino acid/polyamine/organocation transporter (APC superfamily) n=1 Tax=Kitasatospora atroaurantiaca TaxID=285545 RepID=A0A561EL33_9ACTN|nr:APC family permease [Kitasatospora atroaurantiaca]TWE16330.1 amino acid/polyamine/organocation transporter (APC superfamily) [Kitasatospora atroaurantiaca]
MNDNPPRTADPADSERLEALGYRQELRRSLGVLGNISMGFAVVSPVVGLYAVAQVGMSIDGGAWVWALPLCLLGQLLVVCVYSELASQWPLAGGAYQWARRLAGPTFAWLTGWVWQFAVMFANTTVAYLASPWVFALFGATPTPAQLVLVSVGFMVFCTLVNAYGINLLRWFVSLGIAAEAVASVLVGLALLLFFRRHGFGLLTDTLNAPATTGTGGVMSFLAVIAVGGWAFIGFDACVSTAEETKDAARQVPRAMRWALLSVGAVVMLNAVSVVLAHPDPAAVVAGQDLDPVTTAVTAGFGDWSAKPFVIVVLVSFTACLMASQGGAARGLYSLARDGVFPFSRQVRKVNRHKAPIGGLVAATLVSCAALPLGLESTAIGSLITFGTAATFLPFFLLTLTALIARLRGTWQPAGQVSYGRWGTLLNLLAVLWTGLEVINICWPRTILAPPGAPWYQVWAALLGVGLVTLVGAGYLLVRRPQRLMQGVGAERPDTDELAPAVI